MWEPQPLATLRASKACRGENFTFTLPYLYNLTVPFERVGDSYKQDSSSEPSDAINFVIVKLKYAEWNSIQIHISALLSLHDPSVQKLETAVRIKDCEAYNTQN
jgi:hypothetical protein